MFSHLGEEREIEREWAMIILGSQQGVPQK